MQLYQLSFYVPETHLEEVKSALFNAGAGKLAGYENCAWQVKGEGQFLPTNNSTPFLGEKNKLTKLTEYKVEMLCEEKYLDAIIKALKIKHPYEVPAYYVSPIRE